MKSPSSFRLPIVSHQMCKLLPTTLQQEFFQSAILVSIQKSLILTHKFHTQHFRYRYSFWHVQFSRMSKAAKKSWCSSFHDVQSSGQIIISHQPMFPWRGVPFLSYLLGAQNTCEVARIWPETFFADFVSRFSAWLFHSKAFEKDDNSLCFCALDDQNHPSCKWWSKNHRRFKGRKKKHLEKIPCLSCSVELLFRIFLVAWPLVKRVPNVSIQKICANRRKNPVDHKTPLETVLGSHVCHFSIEFSRFFG